MKTCTFQYYRRRKKRWSKAALCALAGRKGLSGRNRYRGALLFNPYSSKDWMALEEKLTAKVHALYGCLLDDENDTPGYTQKTADAEVERDVCRRVIGILFGTRFNTF